MRTPHVPVSLRLLPFRGSQAVAARLLTKDQLLGPAWRRLFPDIYICARVEMNHRRWCEAALLYVGADAVIGGRSAAYLMGVDVLPYGDDQVTVIVPSTRRIRSHPRLVVVRCDLDPSDVLRRRIPITTPQRTAFDVARMLEVEDAVIAVDALTNRRVVTLDELRDYALASRSLPGKRQVTQVLAAAEPLAASPMETRLRLRIVDGGLPRPEAQIVIRDEYGQFVARVDLGYRAQRVGLEYEGDHHREQPTFRRDITRGNAVREAGWTILRVTADDLKDPSTLLRQLRKLLDPQPTSSTPHTRNTPPTRSTPQTRNTPHTRNAPPKGNHPA